MQNAKRKTQNDKLETPSADAEPAQPIQLTPTNRKVAPMERSNHRSFLALIVLASFSGCNNAAPPAAASQPPKVKVAYLGLTCEAPIFVAQEKGFFKEEGLDVELVKTGWDGLREGLGLGRFDASHTLIMYLLKPIEQGLDVKITGGIHTGCLRLQAGVNSDIKSPADLKGKKIGVPAHLGSPPYLFASRVLAANGIDPRPENGEVEWEVYDPEILGLKLQQGQLDAVATSDPIGTILLGQGLVRTIADQAEDEPYSEEYCCAAVVSGKLAKENPAAAAKVTRALLKGAKWVGENPAAAAKLSVVKKYTTASVEINTQALAKLKYLPGVSSCRVSLDQAAHDMQAAGLLKPTTDPSALAKRAWLDLDGVNDDWIGQVEVAKVDAEGRPKLLSPAAFAALFEGRSLCCDCCCLSD
jgi:NitT/TauT family transport system substrate-binding protein